MSFFAFSALINLVTSCLIGIFVFLKNRKGAVNKSYALLSASIAFWSGSYFLWQIARNLSDAFFWVRMLSIGSIFIPICYLNFILCLLNQQKQNRFILIAGFTVSAIFTPLVFTRIFIPSIGPKLSFLFWPDAGILYSFFLVFFFVCVLYACYLMLKAFRMSVGSEYQRHQILYVFIASVVGFLGGSTNYPLWYGLAVPPVLTMLVSVHVLILAYAIIKYRLMDIRVAITRTTIFVAVYGLVLGLPFVLSTSGKTELIRLLGNLWWTAPLVLMAFLGTVGPFIYIYLKNRAEAFLLREQRRYHSILKNAAVDLTRIRSLQKLLDFVAEIIAESVKITHAAVYFLNDTSNCFILKAGISLPSELPGSILKNNPLITWLQKNKESLIHDELKRMTEEDRSPAVEKLEKQLKSLNAAVVVPCFLENKLLDIIILGEKTSGDSYTQEDIDNFAVFASEAALATENALLYDKIENEVKERTQELVQTQKQLVQAEKLATMGTLAGGVAHEINNPLTAILTNAQILLETGQYDKESLEMIEEATKRCRTIVQKLMAYAKKPVEATMVYEINLRESITNAVSFLKFQLEQENITVAINAAEKSYLVKGNHNELEQVITNLLLNAKDAIRKIKKSGRIDLALSRDDTWVTLAIKDEGAGISAQIMGRIFDPFFTTKDVGKGLGLGLSICQSIVDKHKGKITVESQENTGSTFTVYLPRHT